MASAKKRRPARRAKERPQSTPPRREATSVDDVEASGASPRAAGPGAARFRTTLVIVAALYLATVWLDGIGSNLPLKIVPRPFLYFAQVAALFKYAGVMAIDYRAEGWSCADKKWIEIDVRPWFRIDADTKENRFHRALQFYRKERKVMRELEDYVIRSHNTGPGASGRPVIGGVRFLSLRIPYPKIGEHVDPMVRKPLSEYPADMRHEWYWTPTSRRYERCGEQPPPSRPKSDTKSESDAKKDKEDDDGMRDERASSSKAAGRERDPAGKEGDPEP